MTIEITKYVSYEQGNLLGFVSFFIREWGLYLNDCRIIKKKDRGFFIDYPCKKNAESQERYSPYFHFDQMTNERFQKAAIKAVEEWVKKNNPEKVNPSLF